MVIGATFVILWLASGLAGSWLVVWAVGGVNPWLGMRFLTPFPLAMALAGPGNLVAGIVYAVIFRVVPDDAHRE